MATKLQNDNYRENTRKLGLCYSCGLPSPGTFRCNACRNKINEAKAAKRQTKTEMMRAMLNMNTALTAGEIKTLPVDEAFMDRFSHPNTRTQPMRIWKTRVYTAQGNLFATYYFHNAVDAIRSVRNTWSNNKDEIRETPMAEENIYLWVYSSDISRVAVEIKRLDLEILDHATHF